MSLVALHIDDQYEAFGVAQLYSKVSNQAGSKFVMCENSFHFRTAVKISATTQNLACPNSAQLVSDLHNLNPTDDK